MKRSAYDDMLEQGIMSILVAIGKGLKCVGKGIMKLKHLKNIIGLVIAIIFAVTVYFVKPYILVQFGIWEMPNLLQRIAYIVLLMVPFIYLGILGGLQEPADKEREKYNEIFKEIEFKGRDGKYPYFLECYTDDLKRTVYKFKTSINLGEWKKNQERIELALDCTILNIENMESKKIIKVIALSSDYRLPEQILWEDKYTPEKPSCISVGLSAMGGVEFDLDSTPHVLIAGETGSGKSVILHTCLWEMVLKGARIFMMDFKGGVEFGLDYEQYGDVITEREKAIVILEQLVEENSLRLSLFRENRAKNITEYNKKTGSHLCRIVVFCDEIAEMLDTTGVQKKDKEIYDKIKGYLSTLARLSRCTGINLILGVQRPDANILTGQIKNNIPIRICGRFADKAASEIVLNSTAATDIPDIKGRFLFLRGNELIEFQAFYFKDSMMHDVFVDKGIMLTESSKTAIKSSHSHGLETDKNSHNEISEKVDYGLDRFKNMEDVQFSYADDDLVEWSVKK